jgi:hypothetical protein
LASHGIAERRNYYVYATWSAALFLLGCFVCLHPFAMAGAGLGVAAIVPHRMASEPLASP